MRLIEIHGLAATTDVHISESGRRWMLSEAAMLAIASSGFNAPLLVNHAGDPIPLCSGEWKSRGDLRFRGFLDASTPDGYGAALAIRHGWLSQISVGGVPLCETESFDSAGEFVIADRMDVDELSLTGSPRIAGTWVSLAGERPATERTRPSDPTEARALARFLIDRGVLKTDAEVTSAAVSDRPSLCKSPSAPIHRASAIAKSAKTTSASLTANGRLPGMMTGVPHVDRFLAWFDGLPHGDDEPAVMPEAIAARKKFLAEQSRR